MRIGPFEISRSKDNADTTNSVEELKSKQVVTPIKGGRQSVSEFNDGLSSMVSVLDFLIQPEFEIELIGVLEYLAAYNHDVGYAVDNIVSLANTEHTIKFDAGVSDATQKAIMEHLNNKRDCWYNFTDGSNSMNNDFFTQLAVGGAISGEFVIAPDLSGIDQIVRVGLTNIKFLFDKESESFIPVQHKGILGLRAVDGRGYIELNPTTYKYVAMRRFKESPYGLPLFLTALNSIKIQKDMLSNLNFVMEKLGMLGFMEVLMDVPTQQQNEGEAAYNVRVKDHLVQAAAEASKGMKSGLVVGFKNQHEFKHNEVKGDAQGADRIYNLNEQNLMAGLKQSPEMLGRQFNTSETFGRVLLLKFSAQIDNFQRAYASFLKDAYNLEIILAGFAVNNIIKEVEFEKPLLGDMVREEDAFSKKIDNLNKLYNQGVISQQTRAQRLGEDEPDQDEPRMTTEESGSGNDPNPTEDPTNGNTTEKNALKAFEDADDEGKRVLIKYFAKELGAEVPDIHTGDCC